MEAIVNKKIIRGQLYRWKPNNKGFSVRDIYRSIGPMLHNGGWRFQIFYDIRGDRRERFTEFETEAEREMELVFQKK